MNRNTYPADDGLVDLVLADGTIQKLTGPEAIRIGKDLIKFGEQASLLCRDIDVRLERISQRLDDANKEFQRISKQLRRK